MPLQRCESNGWRWGSQGKCYKGKDAKKAAIRQGVAIEGPAGFQAKADEDRELEKAIAEEFTTIERMILIEAAKLSRKSINDLPDSDFAYIEPGGKKDDSGKTTPRSLRHFPIHDAAHVRNALARLPQSSLSSEQKAKALSKIKGAAKKFNVDVSND